METKDQHGMTILQQAAQHGHLEVVQLLLEKRANIEGRDQHGKTALHHAAQHGQLEVVQLLLDNGADIEAKNNYNQTALHQAVTYSQFEVIKLLLEEGANIEAKDNYDQTALHYAAERSGPKVIKLLLEEGANIEAEDNDGKVALYHAAMYGKPEVIKLLLEEGANIDAKNKDGKTALHCAARYRKSEVIKLLLEEGANIEAKDNDSQTALQSIINEYYFFDTSSLAIELLIKKGASIPDNITEIGELGIKIKNLNDLYKKNTNLLANKEFLEACKIASPEIQDILSVRILQKLADFIVTNFSQKERNINSNKEDTTIKDQEILKENSLDKSAIKFEEYGFLRQYQTISEKYPFLLKWIFEDKGLNHDNISNTLDTYIKEHFFEIAGICKSINDSNLRPINSKIIFPQIIKYLSLDDIKKGEEAAREEKLPISTSSLQIISLHNEALSSDNIEEEVIGIIGEIV